MSFGIRKKYIEEGDTIILYLNVNNLHAIEVTSHIKNKKNEVIEKVFQTNFGALKIKSLIGHEYGTKVQLSRGWGYVLQPTPELWTLTLPHRTQIIYTPDISMIIFQLEVKPGSIVIESGTGSGSLSHAFIRAIAPHGHLHTFDFHEVRTQQARDEFKLHGISENVTVIHRDVCELGFSPELEGKADAVFLDLPLPWEAVPHAAKTFKKDGGRFCSFSPCIEQTQKTCVALTQEGFTELTTIELLQTDYNVITRTMPVMNLELLKTKKMEDCQSIESKEREKEIQEMMNNKDDEIKLNKFLYDCNLLEGKKRIVEEPRRFLSDFKDNNKEVIKMLSATTPATQPGHTGYMTFATYPPVWTVR